MQTTTDLRGALLRMLVRGIYAPDEPSPSPAADTGNEPPDGAAGDGEGTDDDDGDGESDVTPSDKKRLSDEAAKYRRLRNEERVQREAAEAKVKAAEERIAALEDGKASEALTAENQDLRLRMAFNDECHHHNVSDREAIWKLAGDDINVAVKDDGTVDVERLRTVVGSLVERYPHFVRDDGPDELPAGHGLPPSGKRTDGKSRNLPNDLSNRSALAKKFPALRGH